MLCLQRNVGEYIVIKGPTGEETWVKVGRITIDGQDVLGRVTLEIAAPMNYEVDRREVYDQKQKQRLQKKRPPS